MDIEQDDDFWEEIPSTGQSGTVALYNRTQRLTQDPGPEGQEFRRDVEDGKRLMAARSQGRREFVRVYKEIFKDELGPPKAMLPSPGPIDRLSEAEYQRYVQMVKAAESGDQAGLRTLIEQAQEQRVEA